MQHPSRLRALAAILLLAPLLMPTGTAQIPDLLPGIEVTCQYDSDPAMLDVSSDSGYVTAVCTLDNPTAYNEDVKIEYTNDGMTVIGPEDRTVNAGESVDFDVMISTMGSDKNPQIHNITVEVEVTSVQGTDWSDFLANFRPTDDANILVEIASFSDIQLDITPQIIPIEGGGMPVSVNVMVRNFGNDEDSYALELSDELTSRGFIVNVSTDQDTADVDGSVTFTVVLTPPESLDTEIIEVTITASSTVRSLSVTEIFTVEATAAPESILDLSSMNIPMWAFIAGGVLGLLVVVAILTIITRKIKSVSSRFESEYTPSEPSATKPSRVAKKSSVDDDLDDLDDFEF